MCHEYGDIHPMREVQLTSSVLDFPPIAPVVDFAFKISVGHILISYPSTVYR